eukprot:1136215-Pelagomonas_calceolata.AAC.5
MQRQQQHVPMQRTTLRPPGAPARKQLSGLRTPQPPILRPSLDLLSGLCAISTYLAALPNSLQWKGTCPRLDDFKGLAILGRQPPVTMPATKEMMSHEAC